MDDQPAWKTFVGCLILPLVLVIGVPVVALLNIFGLNRKNAKPQYVIDYLERFIAGDEGGWEWDDFSSIPLVDPKLEDIRQRACSAGPWSAKGVDIDKLRELLEEARQLDRDPS